MQIREITCKSILTKSGISAIDYAVNPYVGCQHGCAYCYAVFMKRFTGHREEWGQFVDVRLNAPEVLARQLARAKPGDVTLGTVTDAYQPLERKYRLSRACLKALAPYEQFPTTVLTKSALVLRDLDVLCEMKNPEVAFTITTLNDAVRRILEPCASPISARMQALARLHDAGIRTWVFFGPALPVFSDAEDDVDSLFAQLAGVGVSRVLVDVIHLRGLSWKRMSAALQRDNPQALERYRRIQSDPREYRQSLAERAIRSADRHHIPCDLAF